MDSIDNFDMDWQSLEDKTFIKDIRCYRITINHGKAYRGKTIFRAIGPEGTMTLLDNKTKGRKKLLELIIGNPKTFLDTAEKPLIPDGYWTCGCKTEWVHTPFQSVCPKCDCSIINNTKKAEYIKDADFKKV